MPSFLDFMGRAAIGPIMSEDDFNMRVLVPHIRKAVREYGIVYDPNDPLPSDNDLAERLFEAAVEFLVQTGVYCDFRNRIMRFSREEILEAIGNLPEGAMLGEGRERRLFKSRMPEDGSPPWCFVGGGIAASSEAIAFAQVEGYGKIPLACGISIPSISRVKGMPTIGGSPLELYAAIDSVQVGRRALQRCGRPGLPIMNLNSAATTATGTIAGSYPAFGVRPSDGWLIDVIAEMRISSDALNRLAFVLSIGGNIGSTGLPILGGYAGGPEGTALIMTTYYLIGILLFQGTYHLTCPIHFQHQCSSTRDCLWVYSIVGRATSRHTRYPDLANGYAAAGPSTKMYFYEAAAINLVSVASGYGGVETVHPAKAVVEDGITPLEARFCTEVAHAAAGMRIDQVREIVTKLLGKYESTITNPPQGRRFQECFDVVSGTPNEDYNRIYQEVKDELSEMGIPLHA
jgi:methylamine--corrinoid protein Co-methyltransferase